MIDAFPLCDTKVRCDPTCLAFGQIANSASHVKCNMKAVWVCVLDHFCAVLKSTDTEQVPAPDLPFAMDATALGLYTNCDLFLVAKKRILPGDWFSWHYPMCDAKTPTKLPAPEPYLKSPLKTKRIREAESIAPVSPSSCKTATWTPMFPLGTKKILAPALAHAGKTENARLAQIKHDCTHHTKCPLGKCSDCKCAPCAANQVAAGEKRPRSRSVAISSFIFNTSCNKNLR